MAAINESIHVNKDPTRSTIEDMCDLSSEGEFQLEGSLMYCHNPTTQLSSDDLEILSRPILVGYAFGPKKMSTMGVVMAEASKTNLSSVSTTVLVEEEDEEAEDEDAEDEVEQAQKITLVCGNDDDEEESSARDEQQQHKQQQQQQVCIGDEKSTTAASSGNKNTACFSPRRKSQDANLGNILLSLDSYNGGLKNIVRYIHSSCSSVDTSSTTTTHLTTGTTLTGVTPSSGSTCRLGAGASISSGKSAGQQQHRLRVSFVPLDPDLPLDGQHGAKMDIILHKLTEDILCLSKFSPTHPDLVSNLGGTNGHFERVLNDLQPRLPSDAKGAIMRVHRLMQYHKNHPECSLADDPAKVLTLMSRSDIAHALADCLVGVTSASGIPVASPKFVVWQPNAMESSDQTGTIARCLREAQMSYPLIAKPLQAAGTKISHHMTVLLQESALDRIQNSFCLLQQYANHDAVLYKVYVLGNNVHVYQRPSLPNLPPHFRKTSSHQPGPSFVDFDSQRPYPRLSDFGVEDGNGDAKHTPLNSSTPTSSPTWPAKSPAVAVTAQEVQPIVDTLKKAFGLELFGFDILITSGGGKNDSDEDRQMLVVDVNYFPSYKEVSNFPSLLAQYLTQRAIDSRRKSHAGKSEDCCHEGDRID